MNFDWFLNPIKNHYADFEGRATLKEFWMFILYWLLISIGLYILSGIIGGAAKLIHTLIALVIFVPSLAIGARRLHDTGKSGWWQLLCLIPFIGVIILIVLLAQKGEAGANQYGSPVGDDNKNQDGAMPGVKSADPKTLASSSGATERNN
jgi:uncharacterized membrane protein YhaH (DUF805 family)